MEGAGLPRHTWVLAAALHLGRLAGKSPFVIEARAADRDAARRDGHQRAALSGKVVLEHAIRDDEVAAAYCEDGATLRAPKQPLCQKQVYIDVD
jgi:hypothetical protein